MSIGESTEKSKGYFSKYESFTRSSRFKPEAIFFHSAADVFVVRCKYSESRKRSEKRNDIFRPISALCIFIKQAKYHVLRTFPENYVGTSIRINTDIFVYLHRTT